MKIKILGPMDDKCFNLEKVVLEAVLNLGLDCQIDRETDFVEIAKFGVFDTPGLVVENLLVLSGYQPKLNQVERAIQSRLNLLN